MRAARRRVAVAASRMCTSVNSVAFLSATDAFTRCAEAAVDVMRLVELQSAPIAGVTGSRRAVGPKRTGPPINSHDSGGLVPHAAVAMHPLRAIRRLAVVLLAAANAEVRHVQPARRLQPDGQGSVGPVEPPPLGSGRLRVVMYVLPLVAVASCIAAACSASVLANLRQCALGRPSLPLAGSVTMKGVARGGIPVGSRNTRNSTIVTIVNVYVPSGPAKVVTGGAAPPAGGTALPRLAPWRSAAFATRVMQNRTVGVQPARPFGIGKKVNARWFASSVSRLRAETWPKVCPIRPCSRGFIHGRARLHWAKML